MTTLADVFQPLGFELRSRGQRRANPDFLRYETARVVGKMPLVGGSYDPRSAEHELLVVMAADGREYACCRRGPNYAISPLLQFLPRNVE